MSPSPRYNARSWQPSLAVIAVTLVLASCADAAGPDLGPVLFDVTIGCYPSPDPPFTCSGPTTFSHGDTMTIGEVLIDTTLYHHEAHVTVRAICWQNLEIRRDGQLVDYVPRTSTCPDSTLLQGDNAPYVVNVRAFRFLVPDAWTAGTYTVRSLMLVDPPATVARSFSIR